jgi:two-component system response regulator DesR
MTKILLVADLALFRRALAIVLSQADGLDVIADVETTGADDAARALPADVAVVDVNTRRSAAFSAVRAIATHAPNCAILALTGAAPPAALRGALDSQVRGFLSISADTPALITAVRRVAAGERFIEPGIVRAALRVPRNPLTPREIDVLRLAADGLSGAEIAAALFLAEGTVRNYLSQIVRKIGARSRLDAIRTATEASWL